MIQAGQVLIHSGVLLEGVFHSQNPYSIYKNDFGPGLQHFEYGGESDQPPGVFSNSAHEDSSPHKIIDVSNLVVFYPDQSQVLAVLIPNTEKKFKRGSEELVLANYLLVNLDSSQEPKMYETILTAVYRGEELDSLYFARPNLEKKSMLYFALYEATGSQIFKYRFREQYDFTNYKKGKISLYQVPIHPEEVLPPYLEEQKLREKLLKLPEEIANPDPSAQLIRKCISIFNK